jgi:hypothetical protein
VSEAHDRIGEALESYVHSLPPGDAVDGDFGMLGDWCAVVAMVAVDDQGIPRVEYYLVMRDGNMLPHVVKGLLGEGIDLAIDRTTDGQE